MEAPACRMPPRRLTRRPLSGFHPASSMFNIRLAEQVSRKIGGCRSPPAFAVAKTIPPIRASFLIPVSRPSCLGPSWECSCTVDLNFVPIALRKNASLYPITRDGQNNRLAVSIAPPMQIRHSSRPRRERGIYDSVDHKGECGRSTENWRSRDSRASVRVRGPRFSCPPCRDRGRIQVSRHASRLAGKPWIW